MTAKLINSKRKKRGISYSHIARTLKTKKKPKGYTPQHIRDLLLGKKKNLQLISKIEKIIA